jgi:general secretion pathway protein J
MIPPLLAEHPEPPGHPVRRTTFRRHDRRTHSSPAPSHASSPNGFTLLELIVALTVLGFLIVALSQGIHFGLLAWSTQTRLTGSNDDLATLDNTLRHVIEGMDPGDDLDPAPFVGSRNRLECITALPTAAGVMPSRRMQAVLLVDPAHRLVLRWRPYLNAKRIGPPPLATDTELVSGVAGIDLAYWRPGGWTNAWHTPDLPTLVRIHVQFPDGDPRRWPDIVAAPLLDRP